MKVKPVRKRRFVGYDFCFQRVRSWKGKLLVEVLNISPNMGL